MRKIYSGFTLIELVIVIVILGILSVIAIPKYIDLSADANQAAVNGVAGALSSASATNYAARKVNSGNGVAMANCTSAGLALAGGAVPTGYTIASTALAVDATSVCTLTGPGTKSATFTAIGIS